MRARSLSLPHFLCSIVQLLCLLILSDDIRGDATAVSVVVVTTFSSRYEKWLTTIVDVSRSSNKCVCRCRILSMRKYHDLSRPSSLETPLFPFICFHLQSIRFALSACSRRSSCQFESLVLLQVTVISPCQLSTEMEKSSGSSKWR